MSERAQANSGEELLSMCQSLLKIASSVFSLAVLEAKLARKSLVVIIGFFFLTGLLIISSWFFLMAMLAVAFSMVGIGLLKSLFLIVVLNVFLTLIMMSRIKKFRHNLSFPATRRQLKDHPSINASSPEKL